MLTLPQLERIEAKLDLIIKALGLDKSVNSHDISHTADKVVDMMLKRDKKKSKRYNGV